MTNRGTLRRGLQRGPLVGTPPAAGCCRALMVLFAVVTLGGCADILAQNAQAALSTAQRRAQFELECPDVQTTILSQKTVQGVRWDLAEYTIGARGCGRQEVYLTYCRDQTDCNAMAQSGRVQRAPVPGAGVP